MTITDAIFALVEHIFLMLGAVSTSFLANQMQSPRFYRIIALIMVAVLVDLSRATERSPNIIVVLVDDMGYSDIGCYGGEVQTPHLDRLAAGGLRFTSMYNTSKCFPSRACLLTGVYAQQCSMSRSARGIKNAATLAEVLKTAGYRTLAVGKHHSTVSLYERGFDRFYGFYYGAGKSCANHFNPGLQRAGEGVPARKKGESRAYCFDGEVQAPYYTPDDRSWHTTDTFTDWAIDFLDEYQHEEQPYFLYLSYTAPHDPLHAWPEDIEKYQGVYEQGFAPIREARYQRQQEMQLFGGDPFEISPASHRQWDSLDAATQKDQARRMQVYAAMIDRIDQNIGKLVAKIDEVGETENTLILFASDNGSSAENVDTGEGAIGTLTRWASLQKDWANVSNTPFRYWKNLSHEGGIRTPFIAHWPSVIPTAQRGALNHQPIHFIDVMATVCDITGAQYPAGVTPMQGESFLPALRGEMLPERRQPIFFEYKKGGAVRDGRWKLVTSGLNKGKNGKSSAWELYDLRVDLAEGNDLAAEHPDVVERLRLAWEDWFRQSQQ